MSFIKQSKTLKISLIIPVFNEADSLGPFLTRTNTALQDYFDKKQIEFIFINDGSSDETLERLISFQKNDPRLKIIDLSRNFGKEAALTAGLNNCSGTLAIPIDVDLQDPPELIPIMFNEWKKGYEVVLARRVNRNSDSWLKRITAKFFYKVHNKISCIKIPQNVGDFRLIDRRVVEAINRLTESHRFMKGLFSWVGFKTTYVDYVREKRFSGKSKFNGIKLWNFALEGFTSFSAEPLRFWMYLGTIISLTAFSFGIFIISKVLIQGVDVPGYASLMVAVTFLGGIQLLGIGILGEYLGRTYMESKNRPVFLIREIFESTEI